MFPFLLPWGGCMEYFWRSVQSHSLYKVLCIINSCLKYGLKPQHPKIERLESIVRILWIDKSERGLNQKFTEPEKKHPQSWGVSGTWFYVPRSHVHIPWFRSPEQAGSKRLPSTGSSRIINRRWSLGVWSDGKWSLGWERLRARGTKMWYKG